jgi:phenylalanyl-tRNA synthetase beta chain
MKISYNLLKTLIDFDWPADELASRLTMSGSEVESIEKKGADIEGILAAEVSSVKKIAGSDKLTLCRVHDGRESYQVVCGAPNVANNQVVLFAPPGSKIPGMTLEKTIVHGVESSGMILSEAELQLSDNEDEIAVLPPDITPGTGLVEIIDYRDTIFELEITPNRPDCLSHIGIAREIQALGGGKLKLPSSEVDEIAETAAAALNIGIDDPDGCPRYTGRVIRGVKIRPSPLWLKMIVFYLGMRPINNVVDITNYIMMELGHPLHAFDYDLFAKPEVLVRRAMAGEEFITLDGIGRTLTDEHLMITDGEQGVAIAGIMGGEKSEVSENTSTILLESAYFNPVRIRRGSKALDLATESSRRFERGADPNMAPIANDRACKLISEIADGRILKGLIDAHPGPFVPAIIKLRPSRANSLLGCDISTDRMAQILRDLDIEVTANNDIVAEQPSFRPDLTREIDLIEEIARIHGLDDIPAVFRPGGVLTTPETRKHRVAEKLRSFMVGAGAIEIFPLSLVDSRATERFELSDASLRLMNPISEEMAVIRPNLILSMLPVIERNLNYREKDLFLFELGDVYQPVGKGHLPLQLTNLAIAITGLESSVFWESRSRPRDIFSIKGIVEDLADYLKIGPLKLKPAAHFAFEQTRSFEVYFNEIMAGHLGKLSEKGARIADIKEDVYLAELNFDKIVDLVPEALSMKALDRFPSADRDIAVIVDDGIPAEDIRQAISSNGGGLVDDVWIFDMYRGRNIPQGKKSLAYGIKFRLPDRTLTDEEVDRAQGMIVNALKEKFGAQLRS